VVDCPDFGLLLIRYLDLVVQQRDFSNNLPKWRENFPRGECRQRYRRIPNNRFRPLQIRQRSDNRYDLLAFSIVLRLRFE